uniref:Uncharacterized protein n=1 Tax=Rhizophora mucronata TaxID=61149 RepID=A0A2P2K163_RHIMU
MGPPIWQMDEKHLAFPLRCILRKISGLENTNSHENSASSTANMYPIHKLRERQ